MNTPIAPPNQSAGPCCDLTAAIPGVDVSGLVYLRIQADITVRCVDLDGHPTVHLDVFPPSLWPSSPRTIVDHACHSVLVIFRAIASPGFQLFTGQTYTRVGCPVGIVRNRHHDLHSSPCTAPGIDRWTVGHENSVDTYETTGVLYCACSADRSNVSCSVLSCCSGANICSSDTGGFCT